MCVSFFCRLVESKDKNWTFSWFKVRNEFWLLTTSIHRLKLDGTKKTTLRFSQKVENFDKKFAFYNWWRRFLRKVSVFENFEVFCTLHATFQVWAINQQLRKTFFHFFFLLAFFPWKWEVSFCDNVWEGLHAFAVHFGNDFKKFDNETPTE